MSIENYTDREIALQARVAELEAYLTKAQDELHCTEESLEAASCALPEKYNENFSNGFECMGDFAQALGIAFTSEIGELLSQLSEALALIEASRKPEAVAWMHSKTMCLCETEEEVSLADGDEWAVPLYAAPVVAPDVLKDASRYAKLIAGKRRKYIWNHVLTDEEKEGHSSLEQVLDAMGGAND